MFTPAAPTTTSTTAKLKMRGLGHEVVVSPGCGMRAVRIYHSLSLPHQPSFFDILPAPLPPFVWDLATFWPSVHSSINIWPLLGKPTRPKVGKKKNLPYPSSLPLKMSPKKNFNQNFPNARKVEREEVMSHVKHPYSHLTHVKGLEERKKKKEKKNNSTPFHKNKTEKKHVCTKTHIFQTCLSGWN